jgi:hypothetical protein
MAFQRDKTSSGGGFKRDKAAAPARPGFLEDPGAYLSSMFTNSEGQGIGEQLMHPEQLGTALMDQGVIASDFLTQGAYPKLLDWIGGDTSHVDRVREARRRAGSAGTGMDVAAALAMPSAAAKSAYGPLAKAGIAGLENAAFAGIRPAVEGKGLRDQLSDMAVGGAFGAGGSVAGDLLGTAINAFKAKPKYPTDEALFAAAESTPKNIKEGKTLATKAEKVKDLRISATKGQEGLKELSTKQQEANAAAKSYRQKEPYSYEEVLNTSKLAHEPAGTSAGLLAKAAGRLVDAGGMPMAWLTGGKTRAAGTALEMAGNALNSKAAQKKIEELAASIRNAGVANVPPLSPQDISIMRDYLAKTAGRVGGTSR